MEKKGWSEFMTGLVIALLVLVIFMIFYFLAKGSGFGILSKIKDLFSGLF